MNNEIKIIGETPNPISPVFNTPTPLPFWVFMTLILLILLITLGIYFYTNPNQRKNVLVNLKKKFIQLQRGPQGAGKFTYRYRDLEKQNSQD